MFLVDKPYISDFFKRTVRDNDIPVINTEISRQLGLLPGTRLIFEDEAVLMAQDTSLAGGGAGVALRAMGRPPRGIVRTGPDLGMARVAGVGLVANQATLPIPGGHDPVCP